jgi:ABC-type transport system involved in cytochrome c biogenesis permease subunit
MESICFIASIISLGVSVLLAIWDLVAVKTLTAETINGKHLSTASPAPLPRYLHLTMVIISLILLTIAIAARAIDTGHGPFSNMYEFSMAFSWGNYRDGPVLLVAL